jgi:hypothetical protein
VNNSEKRRVPRQQVKLPVELEGAKGITRDFSSSGIFFETDKSFTPGQPVKFTIVLEYVDLKGPIRMKCRGEILRVEKSGQKIGVAATINSYSFEELQPGIFKAHYYMEEISPKFRVNNRGFGKRLESNQS